jgi:hypothetical protein
MNFKSLLNKLYEDRTAKEGLPRSGEAVKKERAKGSSTDARSKDAARKRVERSRQVPRDKKPKQELIKEVIAVKTKDGKVQLIFKDSFNSDTHTKISKDTLSLSDAQQITGEPNFEQTRASVLLFGDIKAKEPEEKEVKKEKPEEEKERKEKGEEEPEEKKAPEKAKRLSKEEIFQTLSQMGPEQLAQIPPELRQEYFATTRKATPDKVFDEMSYESLSNKFSLNPVSNAPFNQQVLNALIFLAKMKMGASDQEMQTMSIMNPAGMDFTRGAFYTAKKVLSQLGEQCIQNMLSNVESGGSPINDDGMSDLSCGNYRFKVSAGGEMSLSTTEFNQTNKAFKGYVANALVNLLKNPQVIQSDKNLADIFQSGADIKSRFSSELLPSEAVSAILGNETLLNKFKQTRIQDAEGRDLGPIITDNNTLNPQASLENYQKEWQSLSKNLLKGKDSSLRSLIANQVLKTVLRGDGKVDPKFASNHLITANGIFPLSDQYFDVISKQTDIDIKSAKTLTSTDNISDYKPKSAELLKKFSVVVEEKEETPDIKKLIIKADTIDPVQLMVQNILNNFEFSMNSSLLPGFKPKDLNSVEYNYLTIGKKTVKIPVERGQKVSLAMNESVAVIVNDLLLEAFSNNFVLKTLAKVHLLNQAEQSFFEMGSQVLLENEVRPDELKFIYQNVMERVQNEPFRLNWLVNLLNEEDVVEEYKRDYKMEYRNYHGKPKQRKERAARTKAREQLEKKGVVKKGDGKDIDHKKPLRSGGSNGINNLRIRNRSSNRSDNGHKKGEKQNKDWK